MPPLSALGVEVTITDNNLAPIEDGPPMSASDTAAMYDSQEEYGRE